MITLKLNTFLTNFKMSSKDKKYNHTFLSKIEFFKLKRGLNLNIINYISNIKGEPFWMLVLRIKSYNYWLYMKYPYWANITYPKFNFRDIYFFSSLYNIPNKYINDKTYDIFKLYKFNFLNNIAVDVVLDSSSINISYQHELQRYGIVFCSISYAIVNYSHLIIKYFGSVISNKDNFFATLNFAVFSDGTFVYVPKYTKCPIELSTYFRINEIKFGQFERTLIISDEYSKISYLEGCTAANSNRNQQLHAAIVEIVALKNSFIKYSTLQNWYSGDSDGHGGVLNFVTKRGICVGHYSKISWVQFETGSSITWKYPSCILLGNNSEGHFYSVAFTTNYQQADTGTKMIHIGKNSSSVIISKGISAGNSINIYRGLVKFLNSSFYSKNYTQCDSLLISSYSSILTLPCINSQNNNSIIEHEAKVSKINEDQILFCNFRCIGYEESILLIVGGFCKNIINQLPSDFAIEAKLLLNLNIGTFSA